MGPRPYSERSSLPGESPGDNTISEEQVPIQIMADSPSPPTLSPVGVVSPEPDEVISVDCIGDCLPIQEGTPAPDTTVPYYPSQGDTMPYDHALPDFIRQMTNQPNLSNLHSLSLRVVSRLVSLQRMSMYTPNLRELDLEGSQLGSLRDIGCNLKFLQVLKVGRCQLDSLDGTFGLTSLRELYAQKNLITDVSPCSNLPHIRHIDVSNNRIRNISYAGFLSVCNKLRSIVFIGNPATEVPGYREHVRRIIPQLEYLDEISFRNEDNSEDIDAELIENYTERSDASSNEFAPLSPADSIYNLIESEDEGGPLEKSNKQARNEANQELFDANDFEVQEFFSAKNNKNRLLEQAKMTENKNMNFKQKPTNIQKLDKDIENRSKKSNLSLNVDLDEDCVSLPELRLERDKVVKTSVYTKQDLSPSTSFPISSYEKNKERYDEDDTSISNHTVSSFSGQSGKETSIEEINVLPSLCESESEKDTFSEKCPRPSTAGSSSNRINSASGTKYGAIKKRPSTAAPKIEILPVDEEEKLVVESGASKLTSGLPVCGNLTAALRNRKKHLTAWEDQSVSQTKSTTLILVPNEKNCTGIQFDSSGDNADIATKTDEEIVAEDVLASSKKWREAFRRFRSNNRARWEEEDKMDYSNLLGDNSDQRPSHEGDTTLDNEK